jgi:hypothetical protein
MKRITIFLFTTGIISVAFYTGLWLYVRHSLPEAELKAKFVERVQDNTGKAVRIDRLTLTPFFHVQVVNLQLSSTDDFNDNRHLIDLPLLKLNPGLPSLLAGKLTIENVKISEGFRFYLHSERDLDSLKQILSSYRTFFLSFPDTASTLKIEGKKGKLVIPYLTEDRQPEVFAGLNLSLTIREGGEVNGTISGALFNQERKKRGGHYRAEFTIPRDPEKRRRCSIEWKGLDSRLLEALLPAKGPWPRQVSGYLNGTCSLTSGDGYTLEFDISGEQFSFVWERAGMSVRGLPFSVSGSFENISKTGGKISSLECALHDQIIKLSADWNRESDNLNLDITAGNISLDALRSHVTLLSDMSIGGTLSLEGHYRGRLTSLHPDSFGLETTASGIYFGAPGRQQKERVTLSNGKWQIQANMKEISIRLFTMINASDLRIDSETRIKGWEPLESSSRVKIFSDRMDASLPAGAILLGLGKLYEEAHRDNRRGYEQINFLLLPEGKLVNKNDILLTASIDKLMIGEKAHMQDTEMVLDHSKGRCSIKSFDCEGFGSTCLLTGGAYMDREYPFFSIDFSIQDFDFEKYNQVEGGHPVEKGILDVSLDFEMSAFRLAHLYQNGKGEMTLTLRDASLMNSSLQKRVNRYLSARDGTDPELEKLDQVSFATISLRHRAKEIYLRPLRLESQRATLSGYGKWTYVDKLDGKVNLSIHGEDIRKNYPLALSGSLYKPWLVDRRGSEERVLLFNIH